MDLQIRKANISDLESILKLYAEPDIDNGQVLKLSVAEKFFQNVDSTNKCNTSV